MPRPVSVTCQVCLVTKCVDVVCSRLCVSWQRGNEESCARSIQAWRASVMVSVRFQLKAFQAFWNLAGNRRQRNSKCRITYFPDCLIELSQKDVTCIWRETTLNFWEFDRILVYSLTVLCNMLWMYLIQLLAIEFKVLVLESRYKGYSIPWESSPLSLK